MATEAELLFREVLVFVGDLNRMEIWLDRLQKKAKSLGIKVEDFPPSKKTIARAKEEVAKLHKATDDKLQ